MDMQSILGILGVMAAAAGALLAEGDYDAAQSLREEVLRQYGNMAVPKFEELVAQEVKARPVSDQGRSQQLKTMQSLQHEYDTGGQSEGDIAALNLARQQVAGQSGSALASATANMAARGQAGNSGLEAALTQTSGQHAANALGMQSLAASSGARERALQALIASGTGASQMRAGDLQEANYQTGVDEFNSSQRINVGKYNNDTRARRMELELQRLGGYRAAAGDVAAGNEARGDRLRGAMAGAGQALATGGKSFGEFGRAGGAKLGGGGGGAGGGDYGTVIPDSSGVGWSGSNPDEWAQWGSWGG